MTYRLFPVVAVMALLCSCVSKQQKDVEAYLNEEYGMLGAIEVVEVSQVDSLYSPFESLASMTIAYSDFNSKMAKSLAKAEDLVYLQPYYAGKMKDFLKIMNDALAETDDSEYKANLSRVMYSMDHPDRPSLPKNRLGVEASFMVAGEEYTAYFFYNHDGQTIGHSSLENATSFKELLNLKDKYRSLRSEIESELR